MNRIVVASGVLLVALVALAPAATAQVGGFGYRVPTGGGGASHPLSGGGPSVFAFADDNANLRPDPGEPLYVAGCVCPVQTNDVRIGYPAVGALGGKVKGTDADAADPLDSIDGSLMFFDADADDSFSLGDTAYIDLDAGNTQRISQGDVVLNGPDAGTVVASGDPLINQLLESLSGQIGYWDADGSNSYSAGDGVYLDANSDNQVSSPDIRLGTVSGLPFGAVVSPYDSDSSNVLVDANAPVNVIYIDGDGNTRLDIDDPVFLGVNTDTVRGADIRIANAAGDGVGTTATGSDGDLGKPASLVGGSFSFNDINNDDVVQPSEVLYFRVADSGSNTASARDIILSGPDAGKFVAHADSHLNTPLRDAPGSLRALDVDGDNVYSAGDLVYWDSDGDGFVSAGDVQLTAHVAPAQPTDGTDGTDGADGTDTTDGTDGTDTADGSDGGFEDEQAREDAAEAKESADEAREAAEQARETAREAKETAQGAEASADAAREASEGASDDIADLAELLQEEDGGGIPGPGAVLVALAVSAVALVVRRRR